MEHIAVMATKKKSLHFTVYEKYGYDVGKYARPNSG